MADGPTQPGEADCGVPTESETGPVPDTRHTGSSPTSTEQHESHVVVILTGDVTDDVTPRPSTEDTHEGGVPGPVTDLGPPPAYSVNPAPPPRSPDMHTTPPVGEEEHYTGGGARDVGACASCRFWLCELFEWAACAVCCVISVPALILAATPDRRPRGAPRRGKRHFRLGKTFWKLALLLAVVYAAVGAWLLYRDMARELERARRWRT